VIECFRVGSNTTYCRIGGTDRWFMVRKVLVGNVGIGFVDKTHFDCGNVMTREDGIGEGWRVYGGRDGGI